MPQQKVQGDVDFAPAITGTRILCVAANDHNMSCFAFPCTNCIL
jgi:hypothetical protein